MTDRANELARFIEFLTVRFKESERLFANQLEVS